jgi:hypothetical protein
MAGNTGEAGGGEATDGVADAGMDAPAESVDADAAEGSSGTDPGTEGDGNYTIGPNYPVAPEMNVQPGVPAGKVTTFVMNSTESKYFPGLNGPFMRTVAVYVPQQYVPGTPAPFIVAQDGSQWTARMSVALDNLINAHRVPVMIAIMVDNGGGDSKGSERGLEYDTVSGKYAEFVDPRGGLPSAAARGRLPPSRWRGFIRSSITACSRTPARS